MKNERAFLKKLAQNNIEVDQFYESEFEYEKSKRISKNKNKRKKEWE
jgi:hypothetical protein